MNQEIATKVNPATLDGFLELLPSQQMLFEKMLRKIREVYELFGFIPLDTPVVERTDVLLAKTGGETTKQIYYLQKPDQALRFDLTVPLARYVAKNYRDLQFPFRRYQIGKVYRAERPQRGRYREFYQCDIDVIGDGQLGLSNDAEVPSIIYAVFKNLGFDAFTIRVNNRKILTGFFSSLGITGDQQKKVMRVIDKLEKIGPEQTRDELAKLEVPVNSTSKIFDFIGISGSNSDIISQLRKLGVTDSEFVEGVGEMEQVLKTILRFGVPEKYVSFDLKIARGLDYYTGTVYETTLDGYPEMGSVCSGGRYDNLAEYYSENNFPGVGMSIGLTRLFSRLMEKQIINPVNSTPVKVIVIPLDGQMQRSIEVAAEFRQKGIPAQVYLEEAKLGRIFKYADRLKIPYAAIIGGNEVLSGNISLRDMKGQGQIMTTVDGASSVMHHHEKTGEDS